MNSAADVDVDVLLLLLLEVPDPTISSATGSSAHALMVSASASSPMRGEIDDICVTVLVAIGPTVNDTVGLERQLPETDEVEPRFEGVEVTQVRGRQRVDIDQAGLGPTHRQLVEAEHRGERGRVGQGAHAGTTRQRRCDGMGGAIDHQVGGQTKDHLRTNAHGPDDAEGV